jgi:hypothetical protein
MSCSFRTLSSTLRLQLLLTSAPHLRTGPPPPAAPYEDPDRAPAAARYLTQVNPGGIADIVVDLYDPTPGGDVGAALP